MGRCSAMALAAARMAVADAGARPGAARADRAPPSSLGTTMGEARRPRRARARVDPPRPAGGVARACIPRYGSTLLPIHVARAHRRARAWCSRCPAACAAGNYAIGFAADLIRAGRADVVVTGAAEMLQELQFSGFVRLAAMAPERCQPFDLNRQGLILGEGAGLLVLESEAHAVAPRRAPAGRGRRLRPLVRRATTSRARIPTRRAASRAMRAAIERSGITPDDVDFVNAHGTGTRAQRPRRGEGRCATSSAIAASRSRA